MKNTAKHREALTKGLSLLNKIEICNEEMAEAKAEYKKATDDKAKERHEWNYNWYGGKRLTAIAEYAELMKDLIIGVLDIDAVEAASY